MHRWTFKPQQPQKTDHEISAAVHLQAQLSQDLSLGSFGLRECATIQYLRHSAFKVVSEVNGT